jgi:hypothetical protein
MNQYSKWEGPRREWFVTIMIACSLLDFGNDSSCFFILNWSSTKWNKESRSGERVSENNTKEKEKQRTVGFVWPRNGKETHHQPSQQKRKQPVEKHFHLISIVVLFHLPCRSSPLSLSLVAVVGKRSVWGHQEGRACKISWWSTALVSNSADW